MKRTAIALMLRLLVFAIIAASSDAIAEILKVGDEVEITEKTSLMFNGKFFQEARPTQRYKVAAYRPGEKNVYLLVQNQKKQNIAVSVDESAVRLIPLRQRALEAARAGQTKQALELIDAARTADSSNSELASIREIIVESGVAIAGLAAAKTHQARAATEAARIEKNAMVQDRPNLLIRGDDSNYRRAAAMRDEARRLREEASEKLRKSMATYEKSMATLKEFAFTRHSEIALGRAALQLAPSGMTDPRRIYEFVVVGSLGLSDADFTDDEKRRIISLLSDAKAKLGIDSSEAMSLWVVMRATWKVKFGIDAPRVTCPHILAILNDPGLAAMMQRLSDRQLRNELLTQIAVVRTMGQATLLESEKLLIAVGLLYSQMPPAERRTTSVAPNTSLEEFIARIRSSLEKSERSALDDAKALLTDASVGGNQFVEKAISRKGTLDSNDYEIACGIIPFEKAQSAAHRAQLIMSALQLSVRSSCPKKRFGS